MYIVSFCYILVKSDVVRIDFLLWVVKMFLVLQLEQSEL